MQNRYQTIVIDVQIHLSGARRNVQMYTFKISKLFVFKIEQIGVKRMPVHALNSKIIKSIV